MSSAATIKDAFRGVCNGAVEMIDCECGDPGAVDGAGLEGGGRFMRSITTIVITKSVYRFSRCPVDIVTLRIPGYCGPRSFACPVSAVSVPSLSASSGASAQSARVRLCPGYRHVQVNVISVNVISADTCRREAPMICIDGTASVTRPSKGRMRVYPLLYCGV